MKGINVLTAEQIKHWDMTAKTVSGWKLARPKGMWGLRRRIKCAWMVFTGKADVLLWHHQ